MPSAEFPRGSCIHRNLPPDNRSEYLSFMWVTDPRQHGEFVAKVGPDQCSNSNHTGHCVRPLHLFGICILCVSAWCTSHDTAHVQKAEDSFVECLLPHFYSLWSASLQDRWREEAMISGQLVAHLLDTLPDDSEIYICDFTESHNYPACLQLRPRLLRG